MKISQSLFTLQKKKQNATAASCAAENIVYNCDYFREGSEALSNFAHVYQMSVP